MNNGAEILIGTLTAESSEIVSSACAAIESTADSLNGRTSLIREGVILALLPALKITPLEASSALEVKNLILLPHRLNNA